MEKVNAYLVINAGSSSFKFSVYDMPYEKELANGNIQKIGLDDSYYSLKIDGKKIEGKYNVKDHKQALSLMIKLLLENNIINSIDEIKGVGHRVLHGGEFYSDSVLINKEVMSNLIKLIPLGILHLPGQIASIEGTKSLLPNVPMSAVFDTAFHQTIPEENFIYPIPYEWYKKYSIRKYGFHGTSYKYITNKMKKILGKENPNLIILHGGSGVSLAAIKNGKSFDTSMGLTPLDGTMMGTRSGSIDPSIVDFMVKTGKTIDEVMNDLNKNSGFQGICGASDLRDVDALINNNDKNAVLAMRIYVKSIADYIIKYIFELEGNVDAVIFTAGVGENNIVVRKLVINELNKKIGKFIKIDLDEAENNKIAGFKEKQSGIITTSNSDIPFFVVPTNEELMILTDTYQLIKEHEKNKSLQKKLYK